MRLTMKMAGARGLLRALGWSVQGAVPPASPSVVLLAPHTSNWDFVLGLLALRAFGLRPAFLIKAPLMRFPQGVLMRALGGVGVDRAQAGGMVGRASALLAQGRSVGLLPKGTRGSGAWRSGFYHMARSAGVPVTLITLDAGRKEVRLHGPCPLSGDLTGDMTWFRARMLGVRGVRPERLEDVTLREEAAQERAA